MLPKNISLQIDVGDCAHQHAVAHENVRRDGDFFRFGRHDDADVRDDVEIHRMFRLIDAHALELRRERAGDAADGNDTDMYSRPETRQSLDSRQGAERNGDSVET